MEQIKIDYTVVRSDDKDTKNISFSLDHISGKVSIVFGDKSNHVKFDGVQIEDQNHANHLMRCLRSVEFELDKLVEKLNTIYDYE